MMRQYLVQEGLDLALRAGKQGAGSLFARQLCESELQLAGASAQLSRFRDDDIRSLERQPFVLHRGFVGRDRELTRSKAGSAVPIA